MQRSALCRSRREFSNAYLLAKFGIETAENESSDVCRARRGPVAGRRNARASGPVVWAGRSGEDRELGFLRVALEKESRAVSNLAKFAIFCPRVAAWLGRR